jgi:hypothetical protein
MTQRVPNSLIVDAAPCDLMELRSVHEPGDALGLPVVRSSVKDDPPSMPSLVRNSDIPTYAIAFIADATGINIAVNRSITRQLAIDRLQDIQLTTSRPACTVSDTIAQHPEGRPDSLLSRDGIAAEAKLGLDECHLASDRSKGVFALKTTGRPAS